MRKKLGFFMPTIIFAIICYFISKITKVTINWSGFPLILWLNMMLYLPFADANDKK